jgi:predicted nucleic acid-binding protein
LRERLIIDSGVVIKWFVAEPFSLESRRVLADYLNGTIALLAPDLIYAEIGNILWKKQTFQNLPEADATRILTEVQGYAVSITPALALLDDAYRIAITHGRTVYDSLYLALSARESCRFVTADERLAHAVGAAFPQLVWVGDWP